MWTSRGSSLNVELVGRHLGRIEVLETLGEGGMGTVYLGWDSGLERRVALKALRPGRGFDDETRARFLREARILSQLEHPGICRIHDLIEDERNEVLVLEYVEGQTLKEALREGLGPRKRLSIAEQLAGALVAAHAAGVVHRDLKPDNVLVTPDGRVKVLDFGLARSLPRELPDGVEIVPDPAGPRDVFAEVALASEPPEKDVSSRGRSGPPAGVVVDDSRDVKTQVGSVVGTVAYMSPEQARGDDVTLASDMYSLGIILHELFSGRPAYREDLALGERLQVVAEAKTEPLEGVDPDLAVLIGRLQALRPETRPRAEDVLARLQWLADRPRRRRRISLIALGALLLMALGLRHHLRLREAKAKVEVALEEAHRREVEARQVSDFLVEIFEVSDPGSTLGREPTAREVLENGAKRVRTGLENQPLLRARLIETIGNVYEHLGLYDEAAEHFDEALKLYRSEHGSDHVEVARAQALLGDLRRFQDRYEEARRDLEESLAMQRRLPEGQGDPSLLASTLLRLGRMVHEEGDFERADDLLAEALVVWTDRRAPPDRTLAHILEAQAEVANDRGRYAKSLELFERALGVLKDEIGAEHPAVATMQTNLGSVLLEAGHLKEAEEHFRESLRVRSKVLPPDHPNLAISWSYAALVAESRGEFDDAEESYRKALRIFRASVGSKHYNVGAALTLVAGLYVETGRWAEAETALDEAASIWRDMDLQESYNAILVESMRADLAAGRGDWEKAATRAEAVLESWIATTGDGVPEVVDTRLRLAEALTEMGRVAEATTQVELAVLQAREAEEREEAPEAKVAVARALVVQGEVRSAAGESEAAAQALQEALSYLPDETEEIGVRALRARALVGLDDVEKARPILEDLGRRGWVDRKLGLESGRAR